jgi:peroxiredoxin Q/BCP
MTQELSLLGKTVPEFSAVLTNGKTFSLAAQRGRHVVLYFYPKDDTPGCTLEGADFRDRYAQFQVADTDIIGISRDSVKSHEKFQCKMNFPFELLADTDEKVCALLGVMKLKNMYGKQVRGVDRSTFVIDKNGIVRGEWRGVKVPGHADEVLALVQTL